MVEPRWSVAPHTVAARVAAIVLAIAAQPPSSITELAHLVRLPVSTTHRLLTALVTERLVERTVHGRYKLTLDVTRVMCDLAVLRAHITLAVADLAEITRSRVRFGVWHMDGVSYMEHHCGRPGRNSSSEDNVLPVHATALGKALLAFAPEREVRGVLARRLRRYTDRTVTTSDDLLKALAATRSCGMAVAIREFPADDWALAAPLRGPSGVVASLEISGTGSLPSLRSLTPVLRYAASALGRRLAEHPTLLPRGTGPTPLRWPVDPIPSQPTFDNNDGHPIAMATSRHLRDAAPALRARKNGAAEHTSTA